MDYDNLQDIKLKGSTIPELIINQQGFSSHCILYCPRNPHLAPSATFCSAHRSPFRRAKQTAVKSRTAGVPRLSTGDRDHGDHGDKVAWPKSEGGSSHSPTVTVAGKETILVTHFMDGISHPFRGLY